MSRKPTRQQENREEMMRESLKNNKLNSVSVFQWQQKLFEQDVDRNTLIQSVKTFNLFRSYTCRQNT